MITAATLVTTLQVSAANLSQVFKDALACDPTYQAAIANFNAIKQDVPINVANFFPQINADGLVERVRNDNFTESVGNTTGGSILFSQGVFYNNRASYGVDVSQQIFNFTNWAALSNAKAVVRSEAARLNAAYQDLIIRASAAYFNVLKASEILRINIAQKESIARQLLQNRERYKVGLIAITPVFETQASYDTAIAQEIESQNQFASRLEELREITGKRYSTLMGLRGPIPLNPPRPANMDKWVCVAKSQNYSLQAARFAVLAARENIKVAFSGHLPVVNGYAGFNYNFQDNPFGADLASWSKRIVGGFNAQLPVFAGGRVIAQTRQADYIYQATSAECVRTLRSVVSQTIQSYLGVISGISRIEADRQTVESRENALKATEAAYEVGTRTMVDVLQALSLLYFSQEVYARDQYDFLLNNLVLEQSAGTLSPRDLSMTNRLLTKRVPSIRYNQIGKVKRLKGPRPQDIKPIDLSDDTTNSHSNGNGKKTDADKSGVKTKADRTKVKNKSAVKTPKKISKIDRSKLYRNTLKKHHRKVRKHRTARAPQKKMHTKKVMLPESHLVKHLKNS